MCICSILTCFSEKDNPAVGEAGACTVVIGKISLQLGQLNSSC